MNHCYEIESFPEGFNNLVNLLLFSLPWEKVPLVGHIENICKAIQLYDMFLYAEHEKIENLKNFCKLSGSLNIWGLEKVPDKEAAEKTQLDKKPLINRLELGWYDLSARNEEVLNGLCPHPNLKELKLTRYGGTNLSPSWLQEDLLPNLTEVIVDRCYCQSLVSIPAEVASNLKSLSELKVSNCSELQSLGGTSFLNLCRKSLFGIVLSLLRVEVKMSGKKCHHQNR